MKKEGMVTMAEAARELGTTGLRVLMLLREGKLQGEVYDGEWYFSRKSLSACDGVENEAAAPRHCGAGCGSGSCRRPGS